MPPASSFARRRSAVLLAALVVAAAACSDGAGGGGGGDGGDSSPIPSTAVRPFAEVQADDFVFEADPTNLERGIFRVSTTEPMICAIVWGETDAFGNFNNSLAMNGTGIVDHDVFLPGAIPGRTYYYQVQGSTADGTLYRSETATFTIPEPDASGDVAADVDRRPNLALDASVADVSSEFNDSFAAINAIDDSGTSEWSSAGDGDDAFITIDLGTSREIAGVEFITRSMLDGTAVTETYTVTVDDGATLGPFPAGTPAEPNFATIETTGRVFRFDVDTSTGGNVGAVEIRTLAP
jgi:hypothetical protein